MSVAVTDNPKAGDVVLLELPTPGADGCFTSDPYRLDSVTIYHAQRSFAGPNIRQYEAVTPLDAKELAAREAEEAACNDPTAANIAEAVRLRTEADATATHTDLFFNEAVPVKVVGTADYPAWLSTDADNARITHATEDGDGNTVYGQFSYEWDSRGAREGDYFVCWTWTPLPAGDKLSSHFKFSLAGDTVVTTSIPTHRTQSGKYETLLERYLPDVYKGKLSADDRSPDVLDKFNKAIAGGFTTVEDLANQLVDLIDSNATHEAMLPLLASLFGLRPKTDDPTMWRRQIKTAIPLFKQKGTKAGLRAALEQAGIKLIKLTRLWQVVSRYTWQESFTYAGTPSWELAKAALAYDPDNFLLSLRAADSDDYVELTGDYVTFDTEDGVTTMTWAGDGLSVNPISLVEGDSLLVLYKYASVPNVTQQAVEEYVRSLPLADQSDERDREYPPKNWNVRVIDEDDAFFPLVVQSRHPFYEDLVYGQVRTEFAFSENVYNAEEWNNSIRDSNNPCDIGKDFLDPCGDCLGSLFNLDLEIENICDDRVSEALDVVRDYSPFHAVLHTLTFSGSVNEFMSPASEEIEVLLSAGAMDYAVAGSGQMYFNRAMKRGLYENAIYRDDLASGTEVYSGIATGYNDAVILYAPDLLLSGIGLGPDNVLQVLSPSANAGDYVASDPDGHTAAVDAQPADTASFTFRLSNVLTDSVETCDITADNYFILTGITVQDAAEDWSVFINLFSAAMPITDILPDGSVTVPNDGTVPLDIVPPTVNIVYELRDADGNEVGTEGVLSSVTAVPRARVRVSGSFADVRNFIRGKCYFVNGGTQYEIIGFVPGTTDEFYIAGYSGSAAGVPLVVYQRLVDGAVGNFTRRGLKVTVAGVNLESSLGIQNGHNTLVAEEDWVEDGPFMEDFIVTIDGENYFIMDVDGDSPVGSTTFVISGADAAWGTAAEGGSPVDFILTRYEKLPATIPGQQFSLEEHAFRNIDRSGREVVTATSGELGGVQSLTTLAEGVSFTIEYADGRTEKRSL